MTQSTSWPERETDAVGSCAKSHWTPQDRILTPTMKHTPSQLPKKTGNQLQNQGSMMARPSTNNGDDDDDDDDGNGGAGGTVGSVDEAEDQNTP